MTEFKPPITLEELSKIVEESNGLMLAIATIAANEWRQGTSSRAVMMAIISALSGFVSAAKSEGRWEDMTDDVLLAMLLREALTFIHSPQGAEDREIH